MIPDRTMDVSIGDGLNSVTVSLVGATVVSWVCNGREQLFLSSRAVLDGSKPIRGGIPIVFPQFGPPAGRRHKGLGQHGFARNLVWALAGRTESAMTFELSDSERTVAYPYKFRLTYTVTMSPVQPTQGGRLECRMTVSNLSREPMPFELLLHTYLRVSDVDTVALKGLGTAQAQLDRVDSESAYDEDGVLVLSGAIDRSYYGVHEQVVVRDVGMQRTLLIEREGLPDVVVWNPGMEGARGMADMGPGEHRSMLCVEPGAIDNYPVTLGPGASWDGRQTLYVSALCDNAPASD